MEEEDSFEDALAMRRSPRLSMTPTNSRSVLTITPPPSPQQRNAIKYTEVNLIKSHNTPASQRNRLVALFFTVLFLLGMLWISVFDTHQDSDVGGPNSEEMMEQAMAVVQPMIYLGIVMIVLGICTCWSGLKVHQEDESNRIRVVRGDSDLDKMTEELPLGRRAAMCEPSEQQRIWAEQALGKT